MKFENGAPAGGDIAAHFRRSADTLTRAADDPDLHMTVGRIVDAIVQALRAGKKLLIAGNGGSAADAQHIAGEFVSRFCFDRGPLPAIALTTDTSLLTAIGNDYGFDQVFERQVRGIGTRGDVFLAISTSGRSPNVLTALRAAREMGIVTIGFTGASGGSMGDLCDICLQAPSDETPQIQQIHIVAYHAVCGEVEKAMFGKTSAVRS